MALVVLLATSTVQKHIILVSGTGATYSGTVVDYVLVVYGTGSHYCEQ